MPYIRESLVWAPFYAFLLVLVYRNFGNQAIYWLIASVLLVLITDQVSSGFIKNLFRIPRPCRDSFLDPVANLRINRCPTSYSFTSSHAVNHFAIASFWISTLKRHIKWVRWLLLWAACISYAQIYVGVHFPMDVIAGATVGWFLGNLFGVIFNSKFELQLIQKTNTA